VSKLLTLDDGGARRVGLVGVKAARLAEARARGMRVLPGLIVPIAESRPAVRIGLEALARSNRDTAWMAQGETHVEPALAQELVRARELGDRLVVRSSTRLDDAGVWSGAFASYCDVALGELGTAVRGCWMSIFAPRVLAGLDRTQTDARDVGMAVLIQPQVFPSAGGWTRLTAGVTDVVVVPGNPAQLLAGHERGVGVSVLEDDTIAAPSCGLPLPQTLLRDLARTARHAERACGANALEWAIVDGQVTVFQLGLAHSMTPTTQVKLHGAFGTSGYRRLAKILMSRRGPLADLLLGPWAAAAPEDLTATPVEGAPAALLLAELLSLAAELAGKVVKSLRIEPEEIVERLTRSDTSLADRLGMIQVDRQMAARLLGVSDQLASQLTARGALRVPEQLWWQSRGWVEATVCAGSPPFPASGRLGDRWADAIFGVAAWHGERSTGLAAASGRAVGRIANVYKGSDVSHARPGDVLVTNRPLQEIAPWLWDASALVTREGSPAAHLCEVARSLRIPSVVSADLGNAPDGAAIAVDGASGEVWLWKS
jgi:phosphohistidine swiveling domain-containing protein